MRHTLDLFNVFRDMTARERAETYFDVVNYHHLTPMAFEAEA